MTFICHTLAYSFAKKVRQLPKGKDGSKGGKGGKGGTHRDGSFVLSVLSDNTKEPSLCVIPCVLFL